MPAQLFSVAKANSSKAKVVSCATLVSVVATIIDGPAAPVAVDVVVPSAPSPGAEGLVSARVMKASAPAREPNCGRPLDVVGHGDLEASFDAPAPLDGTHEPGLFAIQVRRNGVTGDHRGLG